MPDRDPCMVGDIMPLAMLGPPSEVAAGAGPASGAGVVGGAVIVAAK